MPNSLKKMLGLFSALATIIYLTIYSVAILRLYTKPINLIDNMVAMVIILNIINIKWSWQITGCMYTKRDYMLIRKIVLYLLLVIQILNLMFYYTYDQNVLSEHLLYYGLMSLMSLIVCYSYIFGMSKGKFFVKLFE